MMETYLLLWRHPGGNYDDQIKIRSSTVVRGTNWTVDTFDVGSTEKWTLYFFFLKMTSLSSMSKRVISALLTSAKWTLSTVEGSELRQYSAFSTVWYRFLNFLDERGSSVTLHSWHLRDVCSLRSLHGVVWSWYLTRTCVGPLIEIFRAD